MIQIQRSLPAPEALVPVKTALGSALTILVIDAHEALAHLGPAPHRQSVVVTQKRMLSRTLLDKVRPDAIVSPLINGDWDVVDLALMLETLGYCGDLYAVTRPLPRAELVVREVTAVCPGLNVHLLEIA